MFDRTHAQHVVIMTSNSALDGHSDGTSCSTCYVKSKYCASILRTRAKVLTARCDSAMQTIVQAQVVSSSVEDYTYKNTIYIF